MLKTLIVATTVLMATSALAVEADDAILYRQDVMHTIGANAHAMSLIADGKIPFDKAFLAHADVLAAAAALAADAFKENTDGKGKEKTTAKPAVWTDQAKFEEGLRKLEEQAEAVVSLAASGGTDAAKGALGDLFKTCKGCHDDYRTK